MRLLFTLSLLFSFLFFNHIYAASLEVTALSCDHRDSPLGITSASPKLGWQLVSTKTNVLQHAYRVLVAESKAQLDKNMGIVWDSRKVLSGASINVPFAGSKLSPTKRYYWKVMVWTGPKDSAWSAVDSWQMGLVEKGDWKAAQWIAYEEIADSNIIVPFEHGKGKSHKGQKREDILPMLRKEFALSKKVKDATVFISGLGQFELSINGAKTGDHFLDPGWTLYSKEALYVSFDVTSQLKTGKNAIGVMLGNGFYYIPGERYRKLSGAFGYPKMICRMVVNYTDGTTEDIVSDKSWKTAPSPIFFSSIYGGEDYDANLEQKGWNEPGFDDKSWKGVVSVSGVPMLRSQQYEPIRIFNHFKPVSITKVDSVYVYDLAQNASGIVKIKVKGKKGDTVRLWPGELLKERFVTQSGTGSPYCFTYVLKGDGEEVWQPRFSFYGFRYVQVEGAVPAGRPNASQKPVLLELEGLHMHSDAKPTGSFTCSNELFNRIDTLIKWAIKSNMQSLFMDCPHREKLGWLEQMHLMGNSLQYNYDIATLARKSVHDMMASQTSEGLVAEIAPEYIQFGKPFRDSPEWGSSAVILPWYMYEWYGDTSVLQEAYPMMTRYMDFLAAEDSNYILYEGLGDWYDLGPKAPGFSQLTPQGVTATATWYYDLNIVATIADMLGKKADVAKYQELAAKVKAAFNSQFFNEATALVSTGSQTANSIAVFMGLIDDEHKQMVVDNIVNELREHDNVLTAGDVGYRYLLKVLSDEGQSEVIYDMNNRSDVPGYGYQLEKGATALTESWMARSAVSNNHLMLGHIMEWFYEGVGGIRNAAIAYKRIEIKPEAVGDITSAKTSFSSPYGEILSKWEKKQDSFEIDVVIPANTTATVSIPSNGDRHKATINGSSASDVQMADGRAVFRVGSGSYHISAAL